VDEREIIELANEFGASYFLVSAYKSLNIKESFDDMAMQIKKKFYVPSVESS
jgi:hypothetical protein